MHDSSLVVEIGTHDLAEAVKALAEAKAFLAEDINNEKALELVQAACWKLMKEALVLREIVQFAHQTGTIIKRKGQTLDSISELYREAMIVAESPVISVAESPDRVDVEDKGQNTHPSGMSSRFLVGTSTFRYLFFGNTREYFDRAHDDLEWDFFSVVAESRFKRGLLYVVFSLRFIGLLAGAVSTVVPWSVLSRLLFESRNDSAE